MKQKILVIDDDPALLKLLGLSLKEEGYDVYSALDGIEGLHRAYEHRPALIVLDVMMPRMDGWETCRRLREVCDTPIIMLTAKGDLQHRLEGFSLGADDYVPKPFDIDELLLRIKAVLRRAQRGPPADRPLYYEDGWLTIDLESRKVWRKGELIQLTPIEFKLLAYLFENAGRSLDNEDILTRVWGLECGDTAWVKVHIRHLRRKIEQDPSQPWYILTAPGVGYQFRSLEAKNLTES